MFPVLRRLFREGKSALVFSYGVTNAGKSFTMVGDDKNKGILPNTLEWIFQFKSAVDKTTAPPSEIFSKNSIGLEELFCLQRDFYSDESLGEISVRSLTVEISCFEIYNDEF